MERSYAWGMPGRYDFGVVRLLGPGLCNCLFPWARSMVAARRYGLIPIFPTWLNLSVGPFIRWQQDKRTYHDLFFPSGEYCSGVGRLYALAFARRVCRGENLYLDCAEPGKMYCFSGSQTFFDGMLQEHEYLRGRLLAMTLPRHLSKIPDEPGAWIGVHVRCSDFGRPASEQDLLDGKDNCRQPLQWYVDAALSLRAILGRPVPVKVFSDGSDDELAPLLALENCRRADFGAAIADLHALSRAGVLVASGSTFSMWASFLGRMPVVWYKGQLRQRLYGDDPGAETETAKGNESPLPFRQKVLERFRPLLSSS
jgi:hypothetical protein